MFGVGEDCSECLFGLHLIALLHTQLTEVRIDGTVVTVLDDHRIGAVYHEAYEEAMANEPRGEYVVCLEPIVHEKKVLDDADIEQQVRQMRDSGMPVKKIAEVLSADTGVSKKEMYSRVLNLLK